MAEWINADAWKENELRGENVETERNRERERERKCAINCPLFFTVFTNNKKKQLDVMCCLLVQYTSMVVRCRSLNDYSTAINDLLLIIDG